MGNKSICTDKKVIVDTHNGVVFYDDASCKIKKYHNKGFKNIYSVIVKYRVPTPSKYRVFRMDYGDFLLAQDRFFIETNTQSYRPSRMVIKEVNLLISTFKGNKLLYEDNIRKVEYECQSTNQGKVQAEYHGGWGRKSGIIQYRKWSS